MAFRVAQRSESMGEVGPNLETIFAHISMLIRNVQVLEMVSLVFSYNNLLQEALHTIYNETKLTSKFTVIVKNFMSDLSERPPERLVLLCGVSIGIFVKMCTTFSLASDSTYLIIRHILGASSPPLPLPLCLLTSFMKVFL